MINIVTSLQVKSKSTAVLLVNVLKSIKSLRNGLFYTDISSCILYVSFIIIDVSSTKLNSIFFVRYSIDCVNQPLRKKYEIERNRFIFLVSEVLTTHCPTHGS